MTKKSQQQDTVDATQPHPGRARRRRPRKKPLPYTQGLPWQVIERLVGLSPAATKVHLVLLAMVEKPGSDEVVIALESVDPEKQTLASLTRTSCSQLKRAIKELLEAGLILRIDRRKWWSIYTIDTGHRGPVSGSPKQLIPDSETAHPGAEPKAPKNPYQGEEYGDPSDSPPVAASGRLSSALVHS
jgi:hypothetical protein